MAWEAKGDAADTVGKGGFIEREPSKAEGFYTNNGKKDAFRNLIPGTSLRMMMSELIGFIHEETLLKYYGKTLGVIMDWSPKCHSKVSGEGMEHSWGCAKGKYYSCLPLSDKRRKENFRNSVHNNAWTEARYLQY